MNVNYRTLTDRELERLAYLGDVEAQDEIERREEIADVLDELDAADEQQGLGL